jgi:hypothetical protein
MSIKIREQLFEYISPYTSWIITSFSIGISISIFGVILLYRNQNMLLYLPNPPGITKYPHENPKGYRSPKDWNISGNLLTSEQSSIHMIPTEEHTLTTLDGSKLHVWIMLQPDVDVLTTPVLIYFHGNAGIYIYI